MTDLASLTITEAADLIARGTLLPSDLVEGLIQRTREQEATIQAWAHFDPDTARTAARLADAATAGQPLHGIPFGVKDIIETLDLPTSYGTPILHRPAGMRDAAPVALLKERGAIVFGKAVTTELAHLHPGKTRNPHALTHTPGGSSSGSAAAVAAGMVPFALGTQTTGSVLRPASFCGVFGFKPSFGDVSRSGVFECASSFDTVGWFTRAIEDVEIVRQALVRIAKQPLPEVQLEGLRIGLFRGPEWDKAELGTKTLVESALQTLSRSGAKASEAPAPVWFDDLAGHHRTVAGFEFARAIAFERVERGHLLSRSLVEGRLTDGMTASYEDYAEAQAALGQARLAFAEYMRDFDILITPVAAGEAWSGLTATGDPAFNTAWTALHVPALSIPAFTGAAGLPVGLQLVGPYRRDAALLAGAKSVCRALDVTAVRCVPQN